MYHIIKSTRTYNGIPYCGISSNCIPMEFECLLYAIIEVDILLKRNPVGWSIYLDSGELICDYHPTTANYITVGSISVVK